MTDDTTAHPSWQQRQRSLREDAILDATATLMGDRGYAATSIDDIAAAVGISKPTFYQHFPSKDRVAEAVVRRNIERAESRLDAVEHDIAAGAHARTRLERHLRDAIMLHNGLWATRAQLPLGVRDAPRLRKRRERVWQRYAAIIDRCKSDGDIRTDIDTAIVVRHVVRVFRSDYEDLLADGALTLDQLADALVSLTFNGLRPLDAPDGTADRQAPASRASNVSGRALAPAMSPAAPPVRGDAISGARRLRRMIALALLPAFAMQAEAQATPTLTTHPLTLADVVDAAIRHNPTSRAASAQARAATELYAAARGSWFPTLSFSPGFVASKTTSGAVNGAGTGSVGTLGRQRVTLSPALSLSYLLFDIGGRSGTVGAARETANAATLTRDDDQQQTILQAEQAYFAYQGARAVATAQDANVQTAIASRDVAVGRFRAGLATVADTLQTATALAQARVTAVSARNALAVARSSVATAMGARADVPFAIADEAAPDVAGARTATDALTASVDTLVAHASRRRADLGAAEALANASEQRVRAAKSALLPALQLSATTGHTIANQPAFEGQSYSLQLGFALPLFDGGTRHADLDAARADADASHARLEATATAVVNEVVTSVESLRLAVEQLETSDALLASAVSSEEVARGRYAEGVGNIVDLIAAQSALASARAQAAQSRWNWASSLAQLSRNAGLLGARGQLPAVAAPHLPPTTRPSSSPNESPSPSSD